MTLRCEQPRASSRSRKRLNSLDFLLAERLPTSLKRGVNERRKPLGLEAILVRAVEGLPEIAEVARVDKVGALILSAVAPGVETTKIGASQQGIIGF